VQGKEDGCAVQKKKRNKAHEEKDEKAASAAKRADGNLA